MTSRHCWSRRFCLWPNVVCGAAVAAGPLSASAGSENAELLATSLVLVSPFTLLLSLLFRSRFNASDRRGFIVSVGCGLIAVAWLCLAITAAWLGTGPVLRLIQFLHIGTS